MPFTTCFHGFFDNLLLGVASTDSFFHLPKKKSQEIGNEKGTGDLRLANEVTPVVFVLLGPLRSTFWAFESGRHVYVARYSVFETLPTNFSENSGEASSHRPNAASWNNHVDDLSKPQVKQRAKEAS